MSAPRHFVFLTSLLQFKPQPATAPPVNVDSESQSVVVASSSTDLHILSLYADPVHARVNANAAEVACVRVAPDRDFVALMRWPRTIEFVELLGDQNRVLEYRCQIKEAGKGAPATELLGFHWITADVLCCVATSGIEILQMVRSKSLVKCLKVYALQVNWYLYLPSEHTVVASSGTPGTSLHCIQMKQGAVHRWPRMLLDLDSRLDSATSRRLRIVPKDALLCSLYGAIHLIVAEVASGSQTKLHLFVLRDYACTRLDICIEVPARGGPIRLNIIDNLLLVSVLEDKSTFVYDINSTRPDVPVAASSTIAPLEVPLSRETQCSDVIDPYASHWHPFNGEDTICSAAAGIVCRMLINVENIMHEFAGSDVDLFGFLLRRSGTTYLVLDVLKRLVVAQTPTSWLAYVFDQINKETTSARDPDPLLPEPVALRPRIESRLANSLSSFPSAAPFNEAHASVSNLAALSESGSAGAGSYTAASPKGNRNWSVPSQLEIYTYVLQPVFTSKEINDVALTGIVLEYVASLSRHCLREENCIYELLTTSLLRGGQHRQLQQMLQHQLMPDTERIAQSLLDAHVDNQQLTRNFWQLACDMLARLQKHDLIVKQLLARRQVLQAIVYVRDNGLLRTVAPQPFLQCALDQGDTRLFYNTFRFFEQRNLFLFNNIRFPKSDRCDKFERHFVALIRRSAA